jgi:microsomal prostaglandin-E synthase 2
VKALVHFLESRYTDVEVSPLTKKQLSWSKDYKKVPIAIFGDGKVVCDSSVIIEELLERNKDSSKLNSSFSNAEAKHWETWSTERLAILMYPNMTRSYKDCRELLSYYSSVKGVGIVDAFLVQNVGALGMTLAHGKIKKKYGLTDERAALWTALDEFITKLDKDHKNEKFLGGSSPNIGDIAIYGVLTSAQGLNLYSEMVSRNERLGTWMGEMSAVMPKPLLMN